MAQIWDTQYRAGDWDYVRREEVRYAVLGGCIAGHNRESPKLILDLGCGTGILREHLPLEAIERYTGIDWSNEAIELARRTDHERSAFVAASIDEWAPDGTYDTIIFNEVLYYLPRPLETVTRYARSLRNGGSIFISMWHPARFTSLRRATGMKAMRARSEHSRIWKKIDQRYDVLVDIVVKRDHVRAWRIQQLRPRSL